MNFEKRSSGSALRQSCRAYREAALSYERAFTRGDVRSIEDAFSRMQEIGRAFDQGVEWASRHRTICFGQTIGKR